VFTSMLQPSGDLFADAPKRISRGLRVLHPPARSPTASTPTASAGSCGPQFPWWNAAGISSGQIVKAKGRPGCLAAAPLRPRGLTHRCLVVPATIEGQARGLPRAG
jgi:hypothetical protein